MGRYLYLQICFCILLLSSCYQLSIQSASNQPIVFNGPQILEGTHYKVIRHFYREQALDYIFGINEQQDVLVGRLLQQEAGPHAGVINLQVKRSYEALDAVVSILTLGIYTPTILILEGDVIEWLNPPLASPSPD